MNPLAERPDIRRRVYIAFWRRGDKAPDFERMLRPKAYCPTCDLVVDAVQWWKKGDGQDRPGRYRHFKGNEYQVLGMARHSETEEEMVVYRPLYGEGGLWVRPAAMWAEVVERDGRRQPRFAYIGE